MRSWPEGGSWAGACTGSCEISVEAGPWVGTRAVREQRQLRRLPVEVAGEQAADKADRLRGVGFAPASDVSDARTAGNLLVTARELRERGVPWLLEQVPADASVFVSFDCDLDPPVFGAVSALAPGRLSYVEAWDLLSGIGPRLAGAVFTEYVPALDRGSVSALVLTRLLAALVRL